jgi:hypothetical protein
MISRIYYAARGPAVALLSLLLFASAARPSDADAIAISNSIQANHWPYGTILDPMYASATSDQITDYTRCGDSAIWTGHYLAAEAFRYNVTGAADALTNVKAAIAGIQGLVDVTGTGVLARCQFPASSPYAASIASQESSNGIFTNTSTGYQWVGNTSRDEYSGVFFGLGVTYDMVNDAGVQSSVSSLVTTLLDFLRNHAWTVVMPGGSVPTTFVGFADEQLSFMNVGLHVNPQHYAGDWELSSSLLALEVPVPIGVDLAGGTGSYFKFNLDEIDLYNLIRLDSSSNHSIFTGAYSLLWGYLGSHQNAFFNMITRALNGANSTRDSQTVTLLNQWLLRPTRDVAVDLVGQFPSCGSTDEACQPVPVPLRPTTDFLWQRDPLSPAVLDGALLRPRHIGLRRQCSLADDNTYQHDRVSRIDSVALRVEPSHCHGFGHLRFPAPNTGWSDCYRDRLRGDRQAGSALLCVADSDQFRDSIGHGARSSFRIYRRSNDYRERCRGRSRNLCRIAAQFRRE